jgi:hypothetical protein
VILTDRDNRIICLWLAGWKTESIATEVGMSPTRLRYRAREVGLPARKIRAVNLWPCIVAWARKGHSAVEIAKGIKCTKPEVAAGCGNSGGFNVKQPRKKVAAHIRSKASKRGWATRKLQDRARQADAAEAGKIDQGIAA